MSRLIDLYPETLRDIYDKIEEALIDLDAASSTVDIAFYATEWIRKQWCGQWLIPKMWGAPAARQDPESGVLPNAVAQIDPVSTRRGGELRLAVWTIMVERAMRQPCRVATAVAARVEAEWSRHSVYVPKAPEIDRAIRDAQIWQDFGGFSTIDAIVRKHGVSQSDAYRIYRRLQKNKDEREQPSLF